MSDQDSIRGVLYSRFSTDQQGGSVEQQQKWAYQAAPQAGIAIIKEFADHGKRGYDFAGRGGLKSLIEFLADEKRLGRPIQVIVLWDTSRLSRSDSLETAAHLHAIREHGVEALFTNAGWTYLNRTTDRVLLNLSQDLTNEAYSKGHGKNSARGRLANVTDRLWNGAAAPYGYRRLFRTPDEKRRRPYLVPGDPQEVETVRWVFETYAAGDLGLRGIATELNRRGVPTPYAKRYPGRVNKWGAGKVRDLLSNAVYVGTVRWGRKRVGRFAVLVKGEVKGVTELEDEVRQGKASRNDAQRGKTPKAEWHEETGCHEPLVALDLFERVQLMLGERRKRTAPRKSDRFVFSTLLRCGVCGHGMVGRTVKGERSYCCSTYLEGGKHACSFNNIREAPLLEGIARKVQQAFLSPQGRETLAQAIRARLAGGGASEADRDELKRQVAALERKADAVARKLAVEEVSALAKAFREEWHQLTEERDQLAARLDALNRVREGKANVESQVAAALDLMKEFVTLVKTAEPARVRKVLRGLISHIETFWVTEQRGKKQFSRFVRGLVWFKKGVLPDWLMSGSGCSSPGRRRGPAAPAA
jgi:site-specific DNA recombinase